MGEDILIVDDDAAIRDSMLEFITRSGYNAQTASSAEEAIELLKSTRVDLVITDIILPGKNGLQLTDLIKQNYDIDIIVMTGYSENYSYEEAINKGASDLVFKPFRFEELMLRLKRVLKERRLTKDRNRILSKLENLAITDGLTKLYNLRHFYNQLEIEIDRSNRYGHPLALLLLDIDNFKTYNDTYGHLEGDKVLVKLGQIITSCLRTMDFAYRYGGEEFTIILPETTGEEAKNVAHRIKTSVEIENFLPESGDVVNITISIGVTEYFKKEPLATVIQRADRAMYKSKAKGRNTISFLLAENAS
ncbi:MAG: diguanylate cyclase [Deltaproteobacteria bacterium]|nr:diguanylate cyclase [Deltaproteobacteria bacterium]MBW1748434.1 diguanylate cyclase [Deltaproteobacteria bacterium]MBW1826756.1 diguanylate cyclase [Deltaproteobacteria bacterium]MBW1968089.1 diguanylate cyclase [Deltaproteobacteria bacterium]MBW2156704.1 diguanylate cyclase [Deltaproteobacteria bacterium]